MQGHTLLIRACMLKNAREACWLVELGADVNARSLQTVGHHKALSNAFGNGLSHRSCFDRHLARRPPIVEAMLGISHASTPGSFAH